MQRHKSAEKASRKSKKFNLINRAIQSRTQTAVRQVLEAKSKKNALAALQRAFSLLDKCVKCKLSHKNNAANKKSRLSRFVNNLAK
jgi:small subunit ribosomal protein S20